MSDTSKPAKSAFYQSGAKVVEESLSAPPRRADFTEQGMTEHRSRHLCKDEDLPALFCAAGNYASSTKLPGWNSLLWRADEGGMCAAADGFCRVTARSPHVPARRTRHHAHDDEHRQRAFRQQPAPGACQQFIPALGGLSELDSIHTPAAPDRRSEKYGKRITVANRIMNMARTHSAA